jgi:UDP-N-acetylmuramoyl-tripeptide--D-alanyl-D-alanine ligase
MWPVDAVLKAVNGTAFRVERQRFSAVSTDSRSIAKGELFIPLKGPNFDGHLFIDEAYSRSGGGSLCDGTRPELYRNAKGSIILVEDTNRALLDLASYKRERTPGRFVAITGSNGKTTTKELLVHLIGNLFPVVFNEKNFNNQVGVAKTILSIAVKPKYGIFEIGTNHEGEIELLAGLVRPHLSLVTNVNASHLEGLRDITGVLKEKVALFQATSPRGHLFINVDDPYLSPYAVRSRHACSTFGIREKADFCLRVTRDRGLEGCDVLLTLRNDSVHTRTRLPGRHNLYNVLSAAALAHFMGVGSTQIAEAVPEFRPYKGRFSPIISRRGFTVVDDSYNANPASMEWAISTLSALPCRGKRIAILGAMKELGGKEAHYHQELGRFLMKSNISLVLLLGEQMEAAFAEINNSRAHLFHDKEQLIDFVSSGIDRDDVVLVKGSRALGMDKIVEVLI